MHKGNYVEFSSYQPEPFLSSEITHTNRAIPLKIFVSTKNGKRYALFYKDNSMPNPGLFTVRLDKIIDLYCTNDSPFESIEEFNRVKNDLIYNNFSWGARVSTKQPKETVKITFKIQDNEKYICNRLEREKRNGKITPLGNNLYLYETVIEDSREMQSWLKTYITRIVKIECSNEYGQQSLDTKFYNDLKKMCSYYDLEFSYSSENSSNSKVNFEYQNYSNENISFPDDIKFDIHNDITNTDMFDIIIKYLLTDFIKPGKNYTGVQIHQFIEQIYYKLLNIDNREELMPSIAKSVNDIILEITKTILKSKIFDISIDSNLIISEIKENLEHLDPKTETDLRQKLPNNIAYKKIQKHESITYDKIFNNYICTHEEYQNDKIPNMLIRKECIIFQIENSFLNRKIINQIRFSKKNYPTYDLPFTYLEKAWLLAALKQPVARIFIKDSIIEQLTNDLVADGVKPLFQNDDFCYYDKYSDGCLSALNDPLLSEKHINSYRDTIKACTMAHSQVDYSSKCLFDLKYVKTKNHTEEEITILPHCIELDIHADKSRLFATTHKAILQHENPNIHPSSTYLIKNINSISICDINKNIDNSVFAKSEVINYIKKHSQTMIYGTLNPNILFLKLHDDGRDAISRFLTEFSAYKEKAIKCSDDNNTYLVAITYPEQDFKQLIIKSLSFGPALNILKLEDYFFANKDNNFEDLMEEIIKDLQSDNKNFNKKTDIKKYHDIIIKHQNKFRDEYIARLKNQVELLSK
jgi:hypothetical protein